MGVDDDDAADDDDATSDDDTTGDDDTSGDDDDACQLPAPEFEHVVDHLSQPVSPDTLLGHHTVMWFYPVAATSG